MMCVFTGRVSRSCGGRPCWWRCWRWGWGICTTLTRSCRPACWTTSVNPCRRWSWVAAQSPAPRRWRRPSHVPGRPSSRLRPGAGREWQWGELLWQSTHCSFDQSFRSFNCLFIIFILFLFNQLNKQINHVSSNRLWLVYSFIYGFVFFI